jgi:hypothetical protein
LLFHHLRLQHCLLLSIIPSFIIHGQWEHVYDALWTLA